jgi:5-methylcytosine-specific restriction endonuclease McrA
MTESHFKVCSKCGEEKPRTEFTKHCRSKDGLESSCKSCRKQYCLKNRALISEYQKQWFKNNREKLLKKKKQYYLKNRERQLEYKRHYYQKNREEVLNRNKKYRLANRDLILGYQKQHYQENREKYLAKSARREALKQEAIPKVLVNCQKEEERLVKIYKLRKLLTKATGIEHHVDHIWPLSKGGPHWSGNLQIITAEENLSKGDSLCEETARVIQESLDEYISARQ